ncbi:MAG: hypothetical protein ABW215_22635 [Kibdelosporangium sp.]
MEKYSYEKKPAFFRCSCAYMFFETELGAQDVVEELSTGLPFNGDVQLDAELDRILGLQDVR